MENNFTRVVNLMDGVAFMYQRLMIIGLLLILLPAYRRRRVQTAIRELIRLAEDML